MVERNLIGVAADGVTDLGNEPLRFRRSIPLLLLPIPVAAADPYSTVRKALDIGAVYLHLGGSSPRDLAD